MNCWRIFRPAIWCWSRASSRNRFPSWKSTVRKTASRRSFPDRPDIVAVATDADIATTLPKLPLNDISAIADFVMNTLHLQARPC
jgi:hypothetical protein